MSFSKATGDKVNSENKSVLIDNNTPLFRKFKPSSTNEKNIAVCFS